MKSIIPQQSWEIMLFVYNDIVWAASTIIFDNNKLFSFPLFLWAIYIL